jgi:hypothetical protein
MCLQHKHLLLVGLLVLGLLLVLVFLLLGALCLKYGSGDTVKVTPMELSASDSRASDCGNKERARKRQVRELMESAATK